MQIKHLAKALAWSLTAAFVFTACQSEEVTAPEQKVPKRVSKQRPSATIQLSISSDIILPKGLIQSVQRSTSFMLENGEKGHLRPRIDFTLSSYKTKLYLRKKGSTDPKEIFSVTIEDGDWQVRDVQGNKIHLSAGMNAHPRLDKAIPELDVDEDGYENSHGVGFHPYAPASHYPKAIPQLGEEWEAAAIICSGDLKENPDDPGAVDPSSEFHEDIWSPVRMLHSLITAETGENYIHSEFNPSDPNLPFRQDGVWLVYPRGISYRYKSLEDYHGLKPLINNLPQLYKQLLQAFADRYEDYKADYAVADPEDYEGDATARAELDDRAEKYIDLAANYDPTKEKKSNYVALSRQYKALYQDAQWLYRTGSPEQQAFVRRYEAPGKLLAPWATMQDVVGEMDIPFCADWTPISIYEEDGKTVLQIHGLKAKSPGSILHYELSVPSSTMATPSMIPSRTAGGRALAYGARRSSFRAGVEAKDPRFISPWDLLDNLETNAGTHYGALWYDQTGNGVHWEHGQWMGGYRDNTYPLVEEVDADYRNLPDEDYFAYHIPNKERMPIFHRTFGVDKEGKKELTENSTYHVLYFLMPHYDSERKSGAIPPPKTRFWLKGKKVNWSKQYTNKYSTPYSSSPFIFIPYDPDPNSPDWTVQKEGQAERDDYVSTTQPQPNQIHWVRLTCRKK